MDKHQARREVLVFLNHGREVPQAEVIQRCKDMGSPLLADQEKIGLLLGFMATELLIEVRGDTFSITEGGRKWLREHPPVS